MNKARYTLAGRGSDGKGLTKHLGRRSDEKGSPKHLSRSSNAKTARSAEKVNADRRTERLTDIAGYIDKCTRQKTEVFILCRLSVD